MMVLVLFVKMKTLRKNKIIHDIKNYLLNMCHYHKKYNEHCKYCKCNKSSMGMGTCWMWLLLGLILIIILGGTMSGGRDTSQKSYLL